MWKPQEATHLRNKMIGQWRHTIILIIDGVGSPSAAAGMHIGDTKGLIYTPNKYRCFMSCVAKFKTHPPSASVLKSQLFQQPSSICVPNQSISYTVINTASVQKILAWFGTPNVCTLYCFIKVCLCRLLICWRFAHFVDDVQDEPWSEGWCVDWPREKWSLYLTNPNNTTIKGKSLKICQSFVLFDPLKNGWHVMTGWFIKMQPITTCPHPSRFPRTRAVDADSVAFHGPGGYDSAEGVCKTIRMY